MRGRIATEALLVLLLSAAPLYAQPAPIPTVLSEARTLIDAGKPAAAVEKLRAITDAADPRVAELLGIAYYHAGDTAHAIDTLQAVLAQLPARSAERLEAVQVLGLSHYLAGHIAESIP